MAVDRSYKDGGSGKGPAVRVGLNLSRFGLNLDRTKGTRVDSCLDCGHFKGINVIDVVTCTPGDRHVGLVVCGEFKSTEG